MPNRREVTRLDISRAYNQVPIEVQEVAITLVKLSNNLLAHSALY
jgi:hypothetical protein